MRMRVIGLALLAAVGCGGADALPRNDAGSTVATLGPCGPSDYLKCFGNTVAYCTCTNQGPQNGIDLAGLPTYDCLGYGWVTDKACDVACDTTINPSSGCIASTQPVPECAQDGTTCWNGQYTWCLKGYPLPTTPCADGTQCTVVPGCQALCLTPSQTVDPSCPTLPGRNDFCSQDTAYYCFCGYLIGTYACSDVGPSCVTAPYYDGYTQTSGEAASCGLPP